MGKKLRVTAIHERGCGFIGRVENEEIYEGVKAGALDWKSHIKPRLEYIQIPTSLFYRLMEMERRSEGNDG